MILGRTTPFGLNELTHELRPLILRSGRTVPPEVSDRLKFFSSRTKWPASTDATLATTGFTRVLARPQGVFSQPRNAAKKILAVQSHGAIHSLSALSREWVMFVCGTVVRSGRAKKSGCRTDLDEPLSLITASWKRSSNHRCPALGAVDQTPCSTFTTPLSVLNRSPDNRPSRSHRRTLPVASRTRWKADEVQRDRWLDSANQQSCFAANRPNTIALCEPSHLLYGLVGSSSASEQDWSSHTVSSMRTRNTQRVPYEEGNARQCAAARREPHRHC